MKQTPASEFERLCRALLVSQDLYRLGSGADNEGAPIQRGDIVEIDAKIALPGITNLLRLIEEAGSLVNVAPAFGHEVPPEVIQALAAFSVLGTLIKADDPTVLVVPASAPSYRFACKLRGSALRFGATELEGEATVLGKVQRVLRPEETVSLVEFLPGMQLVPAQQRQALDQAIEAIQTGGSSVGSMSISHPGAVLTAIAIYR